MSTSKFSIFQTKILVSGKNIELFLNFCIKFWITSFIISNIKKSAHKAQVFSNYPRHLKIWWCFYYEKQDLIETRRKTINFDAHSSTRLTVKPQETPKSDIIRDINKKPKNQDICKNVKELCDKTVDFKIDFTEYYLCLNDTMSAYLVPKYEFVFSKDLSFAKVVLAFSISVTHDIYRQNGNIVKNISLWNLLVK